MRAFPSSLKAGRQHGGGDAVQERSLQKADGWNAGKKKLLSVWFRLGGAPKVPTSNGTTAVEKPPPPPRKRPKSTDAEVVVINQAASRDGASAIMCVLLFKSTSVFSSQFPLCGGRILWYFRDGSPGIKGKCPCDLDRRP